jgi:nitroreductase
MIRIGRSLLALLLLAGIASVVHLRTRPASDSGAPRAEVTVTLAREVFPTAAQLSPARPGEPIAVRDAGGTVLGTLIDSTPQAAGYPGYAGPVPCVIGISPEGRIVGVALLANAESPTFVEFVCEAGLLDQWDGLTVEAAAARQVDAISGATVTSLAIADSVRHTLAAYGAIVASRPARSAWTVWIGRLSWGVLILAFLSAGLGRLLPGLRLVTRVATVTVFGFLAGACLSLALAQGWLAQGIPWTRVPLLATMAVTAVLLPVLTGRGIYCAHICPFGGAQDLAAMLWRWRRPALSRPLVWLLRSLRGAALIGLCTALVAGVAPDLAAMEPFAAFQWRSAPLAAVCLALGFALLAVLCPRTWCLHLCPSGYLLEKCRGLRSAGEGWRLPLSFERGVLLAVLGAALVLARQPRVESVAPAFGTPQPGADPGLVAAAYGDPSSSTLPDVLTTIHQRRSVRHYKDEPVLPGQLDTLVRAAMAAPTAGNAQPWSFVVVTEQRRLLGLSEALPYGKMLAKAGAAIVVCGLPARSLPGDSASHWVLDCATAAQNILLAAQGIGLGAVWVGVYPYEERMAGVRTVCDIPVEVQPLCVISVGVPAGVEQPKDKYAADNVHWEAW